LHRRRRPWRPLAAVCLAAVIPGCSAATGPQFSLNTEGRDPNSITTAQRNAILDTLSRLFGTPDEPRLPDGVTGRIERLKTAAGPIRGDAQGQQWGLFRRHCASCHGIGGDATGPAAAALDPYPRDFRDGVFKWSSTSAGRKPLADGLRRTLRRGVPGTAMPSFAKLAGGERDALVEYVRYLSIRGQTEQYLLEAVVDEDSPLPLAVPEVIEQGVLPPAKSWDDAPAGLVVCVPRGDRAKGSVEKGEVVVPDQQSAASIARGRELFLGRGQCFKCHGRAGNGRGEQSELYDDWNKRKLGATPEETRKLASRFHLPIERLRPRDFTQGVFRGGDRPIDQYRRICAGIAGTPMPPAGPATGNPGLLTPEQIWDVVWFVRSLGEKRN
jgi:mono/diheme cytochrome c family protein